MSIVIYGDLFSFPEGNAATNRVHHYAKGFIENGISVYVICFSNEYLTVHEGIKDGIYFYYPFRQKRRNKYFIIRRYQKLLKYFKTNKLVKKINKQDKIIAINCWTNMIFTYLFAWFLSFIVHDQFNGMVVFVGMDMHFIHHILDQE